MFSLLKSFIGLFSTDIGIDLGTANTLICVPRQGVILMEPSVVAVSKRTNKVLRNGEAVGQMAKEMLYKTPGNIAAIRPLKNGVIADFDITQAMLRYFIKKVHHRNWMYRPRVIIAVPSGITMVEKKAVHNAAEQAGARKVYTVPEPLAAGIGAGLPITEPIGNMIADIGGGTTEVAVITLGNIATQQSLRVAGDDFDEAIVSYVKRNYNVEIGLATSERIKIQIGSAHPLQEELSMDVRGRHHLTGLPTKITLTSQEVREALREPVEAIILAICTTLEQTSPELAADLVDRGIVLAGGGSLLRGLDKAIQEKTGLPTRVADDPLTCVARGTGMILDQLSELQDVLEGWDEHVY
ncbi:MAG TPA: rod shape-determining protein [Planctomycetota bacterium]|nr:rod shape-determining protein [Planctomycetota bacterium]HUW34387.1 rod shape-determining protein [Planctomycetota bacterium]